MDRTERVELTTLTMIEDDRGCILLQDRIDSDFGGLCFPGGHVEPGEPIVLAAIREVREETGLEVSALRLCGLKQFPIPGGRYLVFLFKTSCFSGTLRSSEEGPMAWYHRSEISPDRACDNFEELLSIYDSDSLNEMLWQIEDGEWKLSVI